MNEASSLAIKLSPYPDLGSYGRHIVWRRISGAKNRSPSCPDCYAWGYRCAAHYRRGFCDCGTPGKCSDCGKGKP